MAAGKHLTLAQRQKICDLAAQEYAIESIAKRFGVRVSCVYRTIGDDSRMKRTPRLAGNRKLTPAQRATILVLHDSGMVESQFLAERYRITSSEVNRIVREERAKANGKR